jgi:hypothetical protein
VPQEPIPEPGGIEPIHIVSAAAPLDPIAAYEPTQIIPQVPYQAVVAAPVAPVATAPVFFDDRRPVWPYLVAVLALLLGGLIGFLIGDSRNTEPTVLSPNTAPLGSTLDSTPTVADLQNQVALLTAAQTQAAQDLTDAQAALAQTTAERDALAAQVGTAGGATTGLQADLDASKAQVVKLQADVAAATATLTQTQASLTTVQGQLDTANKTLTALHPVKLANYVNGNLAKVRADAQTNHWVLIEEAGTSPTAAVDTVLAQNPGADTNMVTGSVLIVEVKQV